MKGIELRPGGPGDADALAEILAEGFSTYRAFAPPDWSPPTKDQLLPEQRRGLGMESTWCLVGEAGPGVVAGYVVFMSSVDATWAEKEADLAHLWQLFVRPPWWGIGLGPALLERAHAAARERGFACMRLGVVEAQARARRLYERAGWKQHGDPFDPGLGLPVVEYRLEL